MPSIRNVCGAPPAIPDSPVIWIRSSSCFMALSAAKSKSSALKVLTSAVLLAIRYTQYFSFAVKLLLLADKVIVLLLSAVLTRSCHTFVPSSLKISTSRWLTAISTPVASTVARVTGNDADARSSMILLPSPPDPAAWKVSSLSQAAKHKTVRQQKTI